MSLGAGLIAARNALGQQRLVEENRRLKLVFDDRYRMVGRSPALEKVWDAVGLSPVIQELFYVIETMEGVYELWTSSEERVRELEGDLRRANSIITFVALHTRDGFAALDIAKHDWAARLTAPEPKCCPAKLRSIFVPRGGAWEIRTL